jgi:hypothetical protein
MYFAMFGMSFQHRILPALAPELRVSLRGEQTPQTQCLIASEETLVMLNPPTRVGGGPRVPRPRTQVQIGLIYKEASHCARRRPAPHAQMGVRAGALASRIA